MNGGGTLMLTIYITNKSHPMLDFKGLGLSCFFKWIELSPFV